MALLSITLALLLIYDYYNILNRWTGGFTSLGTFLIAGNIWDPERWEKRNT